MVDKWKAVGCSDAKNVISEEFAKIINLCDDGTYELENEKKVKEGDDAKPDEKGD